MDDDAATDRHAGGEADADAERGSSGAAEGREGETGAMPPRLALVYSRLADDELTAILGL